MTYPLLCAVKPLEGYRLLLEFGNGENREYDFTPNLGHKYYAPLSDVDKFRAVSVNDGEIEWASGQDFCPHTLYADSVAHEGNVPVLHQREVLQTT